MSLPRFYRLLAPAILRTARSVARPFVPKLAERVRDASRLLASVPSRRPTTLRVLVHAASMGELEQCVPVIAAIHRRDPSLEIIVSCSSPSGMRHAATLQHCTAAVYPPFERRGEIQAFLDVVQPDVVMIDRYDVWPLFIDELHRRSISVMVINATFPSAAAHRLMHQTMSVTYQRCARITAVTQEDADALRGLVGMEVSVLPDSRIDRICDRVAKARDTFAYLLRSVPTLIVGSSWDADLSIILPAVQKLSPGALRVIIVPHEPTEQTLLRIQASISCTRLSQASEHTTGHIVVDSVGALLSLYAIGTAAYIGGGFGAGVHSVLEPAGYGIPLACGPRIERSRDAVALQREGACTVLSTTADVELWLRSIVLDGDARQLAGEHARSYITARSGSSALYAQEMFRLLSEKQRAAQSIRP